MRKDNFSEISRLYHQLYPDNPQAYDGFIHMLDVYKHKRPQHLRTRDVDQTQWLYESNTVGMMLYVDLFSGDLKTLIERVDYFCELGITLLHLMPLLAPRVGENDGGYAVRDYRKIDERIGTMNDFALLAEVLHEKGIRLCIDYVLNHTADDHEWALKARGGDSTYQSYYHFFDDEHTVKLIETHLLEVFPKVAPGNFTYLHDVGKWVMTTFYPYQWDLNYANPEVLYGMIENLLFISNVGVDMVRLDAIPYIWKSSGTNCRNLPQVHVIMALFRAVIDYVAPSTALLGEAIVAPDVIIKYFGNEKQLECHSLYNASYMVEIWNTLATRDARHLAKMPYYELPRSAIWINYARCHDDIGWGLDEQKTRLLGFDPSAHKSFLIDFYLGSLPDSFSKGELYEFNPQTMDARNSGTLASLCGLEKAIEARDHYLIELAIKLIYLVHALFLLRRGIPMLYSGDEWAQLNDYSYTGDPSKAKDSRWLHRPYFDWNSRITKDHAMPSTEVFKHPDIHIHALIQQLITVRKSFYGDDIILSEEAIAQGCDHVLIIRQKGLHSEWLLLFNTSEDRQWVFTNGIKRYGLIGKWKDEIQGKTVNLDDSKLLIGPYEVQMLRKS